MTLGFPALFTAVFYVLFTVARESPSRTTVAVLWGGGKHGHGPC